MIFHEQCAGGEIRPVRSSGSSFRARTSTVLEVQSRRTSYNDLKMAVVYRYMLVINGLCKWCHLAIISVEPLELIRLQTACRIYVRLSRSHHSTMSQWRICNYFTELPKTSRDSGTYRKGNLAQSGGQNVDWLQNRHRPTLLCIDFVRPYPSLLIKFVWHCPSLSSKHSLVFTFPLLKTILINI